MGQEFQRARSLEQKLQRIETIKQACDELFQKGSYHDITLTSIAEHIGWSRANLYKYVTTKEEVFLAVAADKRTAYTHALLSAFPLESIYDTQTAASVWSNIAAAHQDWFRYSDLLITIFETNVSLEKLIDFKRGYYEEIDALTKQLPSALGIQGADVEYLFNSITFHAVGITSSCHNNPAVKEALETLGRAPQIRDFRSEMRDFIYMMLRFYSASEPL